MLEARIKLLQQLSVAGCQILVGIIPFFALSPSGLRQCHARTVTLWAKIEHGGGAYPAYLRKALGSYRVQN